MGTTIRVAIEGNAKTEIEAIRQRLKQVQSGLKDVNREISETMRTGGQVSADLTARFKAASNEQAKLRETIRENNREQRERNKLKHEETREAMHTLHATHAISRLVNSPLMRKMLGGQAITGADLVQGALQSERLVKKVSQMAGLGKFSGSVHGVLMAAQMGAEIGTAIRERMDKKEEFKAELQDRIAKGEASASQRSLFEQREGGAAASFLGSVFGRNQGEKAVETNTQVSQSIRGLMAKGPENSQNDQLNAVTGALNAATRDRRGRSLLWETLGAGGFDATSQQFKVLFDHNKETAQHIMADINEANKKKADQLGESTLSDKDMQVVAETIIAKYQQAGDIDSKDADQLNKALATKKSWEELRKEAKTPSEKFYEREEKTQRELSFQIRNKRFESAPTD